MAADAFNRSVTNGWGTADTGGAWTVGSTASNYGVSGGAGTMKAAVAPVRPPTSTVCRLGTWIW